MDQGPIFDRRLRRLRRDRAAAADRVDYLHRLAAEDLAERLDFVRRTFERALVLGALDGGLGARLEERGIAAIVADPGLRFAARAAGVQCDEDRPGFADSSFDLIVSIALLDTVDDLPGALLLARRMLKPGGLFLAALAGAGSLPRLRAAMLAADLGADAGGASPHLHPQIDVRAAGDLLLRAGFAAPVADAHGVDILYPGFAFLVGDLRAMAATNVLAARTRRPVTRIGLAAATAAFAAGAGADGRIAEHFEILTLSGWAPERP
jgi:NADH dehydrogenase [ubiquinone] 1 alpha subcomplex assembly factor 5